MNEKAERINGWLRYAWRHRSNGISYAATGQLIPGIW